jgi:hypothetical protein
MYNKALGRKIQTIPFHFITVAFTTFILFNKLTAAIHTNMILLTFFDAIFTIWVDLHQDIA